MLLDDGYPTAIFHPCDEASVSRVSVAEQTTSASAAGPSLGWSVADVATHPERPITQIRLLETPPDWDLQTTKPGSLLTAFAVDRTYNVWGKTNSDAGTPAHVQFTLGDLRSLSDGEVWAMPKPYAAPQAMTREEFRRHAAASC
ncbi:hypothetical protein [Micromonospora echinaurantiaca]|uniref:hypothetical protein n=1 Tax=Micromonospora echinaurantiaca TaxID=47857 RepID=UPI0037A91EB5